MCVSGGNLIVSDVVHCIQNYDQFFVGLIYVVAGQNNKLFIGEINRKSSKQTCYYIAYIVIRITFDFIFFNIF